MGGWAPLGYEVRDRKLVIVPGDAERVRAIFRRFVQLGSATLVAKELVARGERNKYGQLLDKGVLYRILHNRVYIGDAVHKGTAYPGEHQAIIDRKLWDKVHGITQDAPRKRAAAARAQTPALLKGLIFGPTGCAMTPTHTRKAGKLYRYYVSTGVLRGSDPTCPIRRIPAGEIEAAVTDQLRLLLRSPGIVARTFRAAKPLVAGLTEATVREALHDFDALWDELFPAEQARIVRLLVDRVDIGTDGADIRLRTEGLTDLVKDLGAGSAAKRAA